MHCDGSPPSLCCRKRLLVPTCCVLRAVFIPCLTEKNSSVSFFMEARGGWGSESMQGRLLSSHLGIGTEGFQNVLVLENGKLTVSSGIYGN